jgi:hypothetical protein
LLSHHYSVYPFDIVIASRGLRRFRLGGWSSFITEIIGLHPQRGQTPLEVVATSWMVNQDMFDHTDLVIFSKSSSPVMLQSSPFVERPLGRSLPDIHDICCCHARSRSRKASGSLSACDKNAPTRSWPTSSKRWLVEHDAVDGRVLSELHISVSCSHCGRTWHLPCHDMRGRMRHVANRFGVEIPLYTRNIAT